jgi:UDP-glucuronate 4-epimerase
LQLFIAFGVDVIMNDVLLTGGAGFIGSCTAERLLRKGWKVGIIDNFDPFYPEPWKRLNLKEVQRFGRFSLFECDIRNPAALDDVFRHFRPSVVIHLAARAGVRSSIEQPLLYEQVNVAGTYNLLEVCRNHHVAGFIFGSSSSVYGETARAPFREDDCCLRPISPYAATKLAGESFCYTYSHLYALNVACLRFFTVFGPRQRPDLAIHKFMRLIEAEEAIPIFGNSRPVRLNDLIVAIETATGSAAIRKQLPPQSGDVVLTWADISKARRILGYTPQTSLQEGLIRFVEWYRSHPQRN